MASGWEKPREERTFEKPIGRGVAKVRILAGGTFALQITHVCKEVVRQVLNKILKKVCVSPADRSRVQTTMYFLGTVWSLQVDRGKGLLPGWYEEDDAYEEALKNIGFSEYNRVSIYF